jgi:two-component system KDP operon response regulator KdpE
MTGSTPLRILVVDDEVQIRRALVTNLEVRGYLVDQSVDGEEAIRLAADRHPDAIILDLGLPKVDGIDVVRAIRQWSSVPIVILSVRNDDTEKIEALDAGADDYVVKPFVMGELLARLRAALRRSQPQGIEPVVRAGDLVIDLADTTVTRAGSPIHLTPTEWRFLALLVRNHGRLVSQVQVLSEVWGPSYVRELNYLRTYAGTIRKKIETDPSRPRHLITEPGMGYRFILDSDE